MIAQVIFTCKTRLVNMGCFYFLGRVIETCSSSDSLHSSNRIWIFPPLRGGGGQSPLEIAHHRFNIFLTDPLGGNLLRRLPSTAPKGRTYLQFLCCCLFDVRVYSYGYRN